MKNEKLPQKILNQFESHTPFQQKVWNACAEIPAGEVRTYGWIAKKIGHPKAARAVGSALAANPFAPTVPCHRVIPAGGGFGNYSGDGGVKKKIELLRREGYLKVDSQQTKKW